MRHILFEALSIVLSISGMFAIPTAGSADPGLAAAQVDQAPWVPKLYGFCMDVADSKHRSIPEQARMLRELGFEGAGYSLWLDENLEKNLRTLDQAGLKVHLWETGINVGPKGAPYSPRLPEAMRKLKGRSTTICVVLRGYPPGDPRGMEPAIKALRELGDLAAQLGLRISIYHHTGDWTESVLQALDVAKKVNHPQVGVNFNLCHWLMVDGQKDYRPVLRENVAKIFVVTLNGAKIGSKTWTNGLIQPLDQGDFDNRQFLSTLRDVGYRGPIGLMCYGIPGDAHDYLERSMKVWKVWQAEPNLRFAVPAPGPLADRFGANVQRTMALLASSTPQHRNHVRILVYGQSISEGIWWRHVERDLRARFPHADLEMVNRALGGHASNYLVREAETDVYPFYPDLVIFHVYGAHTCYEQIISRIRSRTAAEVLITTDHLGAGEVPDAQGKFHDDRWTTFMASFIPQVAKRYGCELVDVREPWKHYVVDNKIAAKDLLIDGIHLGEQGNLLYAALISRQLVYRPDLKVASDVVKTYEVGRDVQWKDGKLTLEFDGNRVDAIAGPGEESSTGATVLIDGKKPSDFRECYAFTRAYGPGTKILCVSSEKTPLVEDWTIRVTSVDQAKKSFTFEAIGSKTGPDGTGSSDKRFVSNSGLIVIEAKVEKPAMGSESDWSVDIKQVKPGDEVKFQCYARHSDCYVAPAMKDAALEPAVTLAQGIPSGKHTLVLSADDPSKVRLKALRVYRPAVAAPRAMVYDTVFPGK